MGYEDLQKAVVNRSIRSVKTELEFLKDANILTAAQYTSIISTLPSENAPLATTRTTSPDPIPAANNLSLNEKAGYYQQPTPSATPNPPPPAYPSAPAAPTALCSATALYAYNAQDAGDLQLTPNDRVSVTEYMNAEWWKGRNERTGAEGIFPRSYVRVEEKSGMHMNNNAPMMPNVPSHTPQQSTYGNMPQDVSQGNSGSGEPSKAETQGKKFGKKLGNAAIFGAGATIGGKIVNGIF